MNLKKIIGIFLISFALFDWFFLTFLEFDLWKYFFGIYRSNFPFILFLFTVPYTIAFIGSLLLVNNIADYPKEIKNILLNHYKEIRTVIFAVLIAVLIRSFIAEPFNIPSGSMKPTLLIGDFLFVKKWSYGYSRHSFPFSIPIINGRIFKKIPARGNIVVFKTPEDNRTDYIKRVVGIPGDKIQVINGVVFINNKPISKIQIEDFIEYDFFDRLIKINQFEETVDNIVFKTLDKGHSSMDDTNEYTVKDNYLFVMGDNRDDSQDSRYPLPGFVPIDNLVGEAWFIFFSLENSRFFQFWKWPHSIRYSRVFSKI